MYDEEYEMMSLDEGYLCLTPYLARINAVRASGGLPPLTAGDVASEIRANIEKSVVHFYSDYCIPMKSHWRFNSQRWSRLQSDACQDLQR